MSEPTPKDELDPVVQRSKMPTAEPIIVVDNTPNSGTHGEAVVSTGSDTASAPGAIKRAVIPK